MELPTKDIVFDHLMKTDAEKYADVTTDDIVIHDNGTVRVKGKFVKGFSGNPKGKAPKKKLVDSDLTPDEKKLFGKNAKQALEHLLKTSTTRSEAERVSSKLISYQSPKLSNIESRTFEEKKIEIRWIDQDPKEGGEIIDMSKEEYDIQSIAAQKLLEKEIAD